MITFNPTKPFNLPPLPPKLDFQQREFIDILLKSRTELGELNGYSRSLPNPLLLVSPAVIRESVASSSIENINTTVERVLQMQLFPESELRPPDKGVLRYREAVYWGYEQLKKLPVSTRIVLGIHHRLLPEAKKAYRSTQNAISNSSTGEILYTPPIAADIPAFMNNWENFLHADDGIDPLIKCAIAHYQFEAIHPFSDGNGRTGRILIVLYLIEQKLLTLPILYVSGYINKNRTEYYRRLRAVSREGQWHKFVLYMLNALYTQARMTKEFLFAVTDMLEKTRERIKSEHRKIYSSELVEALFAYPIITPVNLGKRLGVHYRTASRYLAELCSHKILRESIVGKYHLYINKPVLDLLRE